MNQPTTRNNSYVEYIDVFNREGITPSAGIANYLLCFDTDGQSDPLERAYGQEEFKLYQKVCFYIKKGQFRLEVNGQEETVTEGHLLTVMPESVVKMIEKQDTLDFFAVIVYPQLSNQTYKDIGFTYSNAQLSQRYFLSPCPPGQMEVVYNIYQEIKHDILQPGYKYQSIFLRSMLNALFVENINVHRRRPIPLDGNGNSRQYDIYCKFLTALNKHSQEHRDVQYYAKLLDISSKYLSFVCISYSKQNASTWIDNAVIQKAKVLMTVHQYPIGKVSELLHFPSPSSFRRFFKRVTGMTTSEFLNTQKG